MPWRVPADPEGNEFCVLDPRPVYRDCFQPWTAGDSLTRVSVLTISWPFLDWPGSG